MTVTAKAFEYDVLAKGVPEDMSGAEKQNSGGLRPTTSLNYLYHGYSMSVKAEGVASLYYVKPYQPKVAEYGLGLIYSKDQLEEDTNPHRPRVFIRVFPYRQLYAKLNSRPSSVPHWMFHKKSLGSGNVEVSSATASPFSFYINNGRLLYMFTHHNGDSDEFDMNNGTQPLGFGAIVDGIAYPCLGHIFNSNSTKSHNINSGSKKVTRIYRISNGRMCYGSLNFMHKPDDALPSFTSSNAYGWNTDLTKLLNVGSLRPSHTIIRDLTFDTSSELDMSRVEARYHESDYSRDHYYLMLTSLGDYLRGLDPVKVVHPENENIVLYNTDLFLLAQNNDMMVGHVGMNTYKYNWTAHDTFVSIDELADSDSWEHLIVKINNIDPVTSMVDGFNVYNFIFNKVIDSLNFPDQLSKTSEELTRKKKIIFCHAAIRLASRLLVKKHGSIDVCADNAPSLKTSHPELFKFLIKLTGKIKDPIIEEAVAEFNDVTFALQ